MQERIAPSQLEVKHAERLLLAVPAHRGQRQWLTSEQGRQFLDFVTVCQRRGIPPAWLARELDLPEGNLYSVLRRHSSNGDGLADD